MRIGFDAKRAFFNTSGLGNYSRDLISTMSVMYPDNQYVLYTPKCKDSIKFYIGPNVQISTPGKWHKMFKSYWRSIILTQQLKEENIELYHGLSAELPKNIDKTNINSVVTVHDLIFIRYPSLYHSLDRKIYLQKTLHASQVSDAIIAISQQTKRDLIEFLNIDKEKIEVVYQSCNPVFYSAVAENDKKEIKNKYGLPSKYILFVGTIEERKNLLQIVKAINEHNIKIPLVVIGKQRKYYYKVVEYIKEHNIADRVIFYHNVLFNDLPAIYQMAELFVYPSIFEGFGLPIIEALYSKTPVITSKGGCFPEAGGPDTIYIDPENVEELAFQINRVLTDSDLRKRMIENGYNFVQRFNNEKQAEEIMNIYKRCRQ